MEKMNHQQYTAVDRSEESTAIEKSIPIEKCTRIEKCGETFPRLFERPPVTTQGNDPEFMRIMQRYIFGEIWHVGSLSDRMRALCEVVAMTARHTLPALKNHIRSAFNAGCTAPEIREAVYQCSPFTGFPHVMEAQVVMNEVFAEKGISVPLPGAETMEEDEARFETGKKIQNELSMEDMDLSFLPEPYNRWLPYALTAYGMADFGSRSVLSLKERELLNVVILAAVGDGGHLLKLHAQAALSSGNTPEEIVCALVQGSPYMGLPKLLGAVEIIKELL
ncbi:MAG: carboxymuconolactone decarboxylase family protein [Firmicutes bacterium]|nr:carboxymuconolactone decarboxylase family protein [Bacillota bacterium]